MAIHHLDETQPHAFWDRDFPPRLTIRSGDTVVFETQDGSARQITPESGHEAVARMTFEPCHPLTGPVQVEGAEPGDGLAVEVVRLKHKGWGWNAVIPGFGLLADEFPRPYLHHYKLSGNYCEFRPDIRIPFEPFCGVMGVAPRDPGRLNTIPPRENGGNVDIRHLTPGTRLILPVLAPGALFSCGDCHAAQGDGEVNGTGIESPMTVTLRFRLLKGANVPELRFTTPPGKKLTAADEAGYFVATAHGPDLYKNARQAVRYAIDYLATEHDLTREQAYCLCGAAVDLKISQIVDAPNWIVSAYVPLSLFGRRKARTPGAPTRAGLPARNASPPGTRTAGRSSARAEQTSGVQ